MIRNEFGLQYLKETQCEIDTPFIAQKGNLPRMAFSKHRWKQNTHGNRSGTVS